MGANLAGRLGVWKFQGSNLAGRLGGPSSQPDCPSEAQFQKNIGSTDQPDFGQCAKIWPVAWGGPAASQLAHYDCSHQPDFDQCAKIWPVAVIMVCYLAGRLGGPSSQPDFKKLPKSGRSRGAMFIRTEPQSCNLAGRLGGPSSQPDFDQCAKICERGEQKPVAGSNLAGRWGFPGRQSGRSLGAAVQGARGVMKTISFI